MDRQQIINALDILGNKVSDYNKLDALCIGYVTEAESVREAWNRAQKAGAPSKDHQARMFVLLRKAEANAELREACFRDLACALDQILKTRSDEVIKLCLEDYVAQANLCALMDFAGFQRPAIFGKLEVN